MRFQDLGLGEPILRAFAAEGYTVPTPIQIQAIPPVLQGKDLLGCAQTGTGKTAAFAAPILHRLSQTAEPQAHQRSSKRLRALVLAPTRELASQIAESFAAYGANLKLRCAVIFGGVSQHHQVRALKAGIDILVATPGRMLDLMNQGFIDLRSIEVLVLDEADRMLDMGFIHDIRRIVSQLPKERQTLLFSATMPADIRALAGTILRHPVSVQVTPEGTTLEQVEQSVYFVAAKNKPVMLRHFLKSASNKRTLVFTRTKHGADRVVKHLTRDGIHAEAIHSNKSQNARQRALASFKSTKPPVLVATDIASRGIDVDEISHVVNYDIPNVAETYVHRIGRTARAGASGVAVSFCDPHERESLRAIERLIRQKIEVIADQPDYVAEPPTRIRDDKNRQEFDADAPDRGARGREGRGGRGSGYRGKPQSRRAAPQSSHTTHGAHHSKRQGTGVGVAGAGSGAGPSAGRQSFQQRGRGRVRGAARGQAR